MNVSLYKNGVCMRMKDADRTRVGGGKRGKCEGVFSSASFRRLREFCITHDVSGDCWGVTLTIPGCAIVHYDFVKDYVHRLSVWANGRLIPLVWRCELQQRGQAHLHIVCYCKIDSVMGMLIQWQKYIKSSGKCLSREKVAEKIDDLVWVNRMFVNGSHHAFDVQKLSGDFRAWRYLVAHTSKGKQVQSGWPGRQWGIVNKMLFNETGAKTFDLSDSQMFRLRRWVRRLTRRNIRAIGKHYLLTRPETVLQMVEYLQTNETVPF